MKWMVILTLIFFCSNVLDAQVLNIEKERLEQDTLQPFKMKISANIAFFNRTAGENDPNKKTEIELDYSSIYEPQKHAYILIAEIDFERANGEGLMEFGFIHGRINWLKEQKLSYENFGQISYDGTRGLDFRGIVGGGFRYEIENNHEFALYFAPGIMYEHEKWQHPYEEFIYNSNIIKSTNYMALQWSVNELLDLNNTFYYQAGIFEKQLRNRFSNWLILNTKISKRLSLKNSLILNYDDKPIVPITKFIYTFKTGISVNL